MAQSVWVVDDEPLIRTAMMAVLGELGYETRGYGNAEDLYVALVEGVGSPDLLVLDQRLPDEFGRRSFTRCANPHTGTSRCCS